jgi:tetratricopeptide (TPR) repeat protein
MTLALSAGSARSDDANRGKALALVDAAIKMTDSQQAVKLLWQASDIDPTLTEPYIYLGLYYNSKQDFEKLADVYKRLVKYQPREVSGYLNVGEAYMSFSPPKQEEALTWYRKAYQIDPNNSFAALRIGEILAQLGSRDEAIRYLRQASNDSKNPPQANEAQKLLRQLGS